MATQTTHFDMVKQQSAEHVSVGLLNDNFDIIDQVMYNNQEKSEQLADEYNAGTTYNVGDYVRRENYIYKCNTASTTGVWDSTKWDRVKVMDAVETVSESVDNVYGFMGMKNFNRYPYQQGTREINGVKFIDNGDGSITLDGNCSSLATYTMHTRGAGDKNNLIVPNGKYILSGCPAGGSDSKYSIYIGCTKNNAWSMLGRDNGNGALITLDGDDYSKTEVDISISIETRAGQSFNNVTFYPMIRLATDTDSTWQPYAQNNKELTENKVDWVSNGVLGAKNLVHYPYYDGSSKISANVKYTVNADGSISCADTSNGNSIFYMMFRSTQHNLKAGKYILSGCPSGGNSNTYYLWMGFWDGTSNVNTASDKGDGTVVTIMPTSENLPFVIECVAKSGSNMDGKVFKPMLRRIEDTDDTYQPYAMTNKELTDVVNNVPTTAGTYTLQAVRNADNTITYSWV